MISVRHISIYKEVTVDHGGIIVPLGLMDDEEATALACELISVAEELLPSDYDVEEQSLQAARESIQLDRDNRRGS